MHETYVGMDTHKKSIRVAAILPDQEILQWGIANRLSEIRKVVRKLHETATGRIICCYEAGPLGYVLQRQLKAMGIECKVVAPSLIPVKPGDRIKTDRRDARKLAQLLAAGMLEEVFAPTVEQEAARELCRCRQALGKDLMTARHRLSKLLLRREQVYREGRNWTQKHRRWLRQIQLEQSSDQQALEVYLWQIEMLEQQLSHLDEKLHALAESDDYREPVAYLRCFRGVDTLTAILLVCELYSFGRFTSPRGLMNFLGLVPGEDSSGDRQRRGRITKTGNSRVRRLLVESSWHYRHAPRVGQALKKRRQGQPAWVISHADKAMHRLNRRYHKLTFSGKLPSKAVVAVARELSGFVWAVLYQQQAQLQPLS